MRRSDMCIRWLTRSVRGLGFMLAMVLFAGVRSRLESCDIPKSLRGLPITLIAASLVAVSFLGFSGLVDGLLPGALF